MIAEYNRQSFIYGVPGIVLQIGGRIVTVMAENGTMIAAGVVTTVVGTLLLLVGLAFYAKAKGRHPAWCLMAFLSIIGLIVLALLKDRSGAAPVGARR